ncbi:MAG: hypothetical protein Q3962_03295 [Corynebacterium sp.]|nr:hypothetical protein [Corynebacterium sp.]
MSHGKQSIATLMARMMVSSTLAVSTATGLVAVTGITAIQAAALTANDYNAGWQYRYYNPNGTTTDNGSASAANVTSSAPAITGDSSTNFSRTTNFQIQSSTGEYKKYVSPGDSILYDVTFTNTGSVTWAGFSLPSTIRPGIQTAEVILNVPGQSPRRINSAVLTANEMTRYVRGGATYYIGSIPPGASIQLKAKGTAGNLDLDKSWYAEESETTTWYTYQMMPELVLARNNSICVASPDARGLCQTTESSETRTFWNNNLKTNSYVSSIPQFSSNLFLPSIATLSSRNTLPSNSTEIVFRVTNSAGKVFIDTHNYIYDSKTQTSKATQALVPYDTYTADGRYRDIPIYREVKTLSDATAKGVLSFEYTPAKNSDPVVVARKNAVDTIYNIQLGDGATGITTEQRDTALASLINATTVEDVQKIVNDLRNSPALTTAKNAAIAEIDKMTYLDTTQKAKAKQEIAAQTTVDNVIATAKRWAVTDANQNTTFTTGTRKTAIDLINQSSTAINNLQKTAEPDKSQNLNHASRVQALTKLINGMTYLTNDQKVQAAKELDAAPNSSNTVGYYGVFKKWALTNNSQNTTKVTSEKNDDAAKINSPGTVTNDQASTSNSTGSIPDALTVLGSMSYLTPKQKEDYSNAIKAANSPSDIATIIKNAALDNTNQNPTMTDGDKDVARGKINASDATNQQRADYSNAQGNAAAATAALNSIKGLKYLTTDATAPTGTTSDIAAAQAELNKANSAAAIDAVFQKYAQRNADQNTTMSTEDKTAAKATATKATFSDNNSINAAVTQTNADGYKKTAKDYFSKFNYIDSGQKSAYEAAIDASTVVSNSDIDNVIKTWAKTNLANNTTQTDGEKTASTNRINDTTTSALSAIDASNRQGLSSAVQAAITALNNLNYISKSGDNNDLDAAKARLAQATTQEQINQVFRDYATINANKNTTMTTDDRRATVATVAAADFTQSGTVDAATSATNADGYRKTGGENILKNLHYLTGTQPEDAKNALYVATVQSNDDVDKVVKTWATTNNSQNNTKTTGQKTADAATINDEKTSITNAVQLSNQQGIAEYATTSQALIDKLGYLKTSDQTAFDKAKSDIDLQTTKDAIDNLVKAAAKQNAGYNTTMTDGEKSAAQTAIDGQTPSVGVVTSNNNGIKAKADAAYQAIKGLAYLNDGQRSAAETALKQVTSEAQIDAIKRQYAQLNSDQNTTLSTEDKADNKTYISDTTHSADDAMTRSGQDGFKTTAIKLIGELTYLTEPERSAAVTLINKTETASNSEITQVVRDYAGKNADKNTTMTTGDKTTAKKTLATQEAKDAVNTSNGTGHLAYAQTSDSLIEKLKYLDDTTKAAYKTQIDSKDNTTDMDAVVIAAAAENAGKNSTMTAGQQTEAQNKLKGQQPSDAVDTSNAQGIKAYADSADALIAQLKYIPSEQQSYIDQIAKATTKEQINAIVKTAAKANTAANTTMVTEDKTDANGKIDTAIPENSSADTTTLDKLNTAVNDSNADGYKITAKGYISQFQYITTDADKAQYAKDIDDSAIQSKSDVDGVIKTWAKTNLANNNTQTTGEKSASTTKINDSGTSALDAITASNRQGLVTKVNAAIAKLGELNYLTTSGDGNDMDAAKAELAQVTSESAIDTIFQNYAKKNADQNTTMSTEDKDAAKATAGAATFSDDSSITKAISETNANGYKTTAIGYINDMNYLGDTKTEATNKINKAGTASKAQIDAVVKSYAKTNTERNTTQTLGEQTATKTLIDQESTTAQAAVTASNRQGIADYATTSKALIDKLGYLKASNPEAFNKAKSDIDNATDKTAMDSIVKQAAKDNAGYNTTMTGGEKSAAKTAIDGQDPSTAVDTSNAPGIKTQADAADTLIDGLKYLKGDQPTTAKSEIDSQTTVEGINAVVKKYADTNTDQNPTLSTEDKSAYKQYIDALDTTPAQAVEKSNSDGYKTTAKGLIGQLKYLTGDQPKNATDAIDDPAITTNSQIDALVKQYAQTNAAQNSTMTLGQQNKAKSDITTQTAAQAVITSNAEGIKSYAENAKNNQIGKLEYLTTEKDGYNTEIDNALTKEAVDATVKKAALDNLGKNNYQTDGEKAVSTTAINNGTAAESVDTSNRKGLAEDTAKALTAIQGLKYLTTDKTAAAGTQSDIAKATAELANVTTKDQIDEIFRKYAELNADQNTTMSTEDKDSAKNSAAAAKFADANSITAAQNATNANGFKYTANNLIDDLKYLDSTAKQAAQAVVNAAGTATNAQITQAVRDAASANADKNSTMTDGDKTLAKSTLATQDAKTAVDTSNATGNKAHADDADVLIDKLTYLSTDEKADYKKQIAQQSTVSGIDAVVIAAAKDNTSKNYTMTDGQKEEATTTISTQSPSEAVATSNAKGIRADANLALIDIQKLHYLTDPQLEQAEAELNKVTSLDQIEKIKRTYALLNSNQNTTLSTEDKQANEDYINNTANTSSAALTKSDENGYKTTAIGYINALNYLDTTTDKATAIAKINESGTASTSDIDAVVRQWAKTNAEKNTTMTNGEKNKAKSDVDASGVDQAASITNRTGLISDATTAKGLLDELKYLTASTNADDQKVLSDAKDAIDNATDTATMDSAVRTAAKRNTELNPTKTAGQKTADENTITTATPRDAVDLSNKDGIQPYATTAAGLIDSLTYLGDTDKGTYKAQIAQQTTTAGIDAIVKQAALANTTANKTMSTEDKAEATSTINASISDDASTTPNLQAAVDASNADGYKVQAKKLIHELKYLNTDQYKTAEANIDAGSTATKADIDNVILEWAAVNADANTTMTKGEKAQAKATLAKQSAQEAVNTSNAQGHLAEAIAAKALVDQLTYLNLSDPSAVAAAKDTIDNATDTTTMDNAVRDAAKKNADANTTMTDGEKQKAKDEIDGATPTNSVTISNASGLKEKADAAYTAITGLNYLDSADLDAASTALKNVTSEDQIEQIKRNYAQINANKNNTLSTEDHTAYNSYIQDTANSADSAMTKSNADGYKKTAKDMIAALKYLKDSQPTDADAEIMKAETASVAQIDAVVKKYAQTNASQNITMTDGDKSTATKQISADTTAALAAVNISNADGNKAFADYVNNLIGMLNYIDSNGKTTLTNRVNALDNEDAMRNVLLEAAKTNTQNNQTQTDAEKANTDYYIDTAVSTGKNDPAKNTDAIHASNRVGLKPEADAAYTAIAALKYLTDQQRADAKVDLTTVTTEAMIEAIKRNYAQKNSDQNTTLSTEDKAANTTYITDSNNSGDQAMAQSDKDGYKTTAKGLIAQLNYLTKPDQVNEANAEIDLASTASKDDIDKVVREYAETNAKQNTTMTIGEKTAAGQLIPSQDAQTAVNTSNRKGLQEEATAAKALVAKLKYLPNTETQAGDPAAITTADTDIDNAVSTDTMDEAVRTAAKRNADLNSTMTLGQQTAAKAAITAASPTDSVKISNEEGIKTYADTADALIDDLKYIPDQLATYKAQIADALTTTRIDQILRNAAVANTNANPTMSDEDKATAIKTINDSDTKNADAVKASNANGYKTTAKSIIDQLDYLTSNPDQKKAAHDEIDASSITTNAQIEAIVRKYAKTNADQNNTMTAGEKTAAKNDVDSNPIASAPGITNREGLQAKAEAAIAQVNELKYLKPSDTQSGDQNAIDTAIAAINNATDENTMLEAVRSAAKRNTTLNTTKTQGQKDQVTNQITTATADEAVTLSNADGIQKYADEANTQIGDLTYLSNADRKTYTDRVAAATDVATIYQAVKDAALLNTSKNSTMSTEDKATATDTINAAATTPATAVDTSNANGRKTTAKAQIAAMNYLTDTQRRQANDAIDSKASNADIDSVVLSYAATNADQNTTMTNGEKAAAKDKIKSGTAADSVATSNREGLAKQAQAAKDLVSQLNYIKTGDTTAVTTANNAIDNAVDTATMDAAVRTAAQRNAELNSTMTDGEKTAAKQKITNATPTESVSISNADGIKSYADDSDALIGKLKYLSTQEKKGYTDRIAQQTTTADIDAIVKEAAKANTAKNSTMSTEDKQSTSGTIDASATTPTQAVAASNTDGYKTSTKKLIDTFKYLNPTQLQNAKDQVDDANTATEQQIDGVVRTWAKTNADQNKTMTDGEKAAAKAALVNQSASEAVTTSNADGNKTNADAADALIDKLTYLTTEKQGYKDRIAQATSAEAINAIVIEAARDNVSKNTTMTDGDKTKANKDIDAQSPSQAVDTSNGTGIKEKADKATTDIQALKYLTTQQRSDVEAALKLVTTQEQIDAIKREYAQYNSDQNTTLSTEDKEKNKSFIANTTDNSADAAMEQSGKDGYKATIKQLLTTLKYLTTNEQLPAAQAEVDKAETASNDQIDAVVRTYAAINADQNSTMTNGEKAKAKNDLKTQGAQDAVNTSNANGHITQANAAKALVANLKYLVPSATQTGDQSAIDAAITAINNATDTDTMDAAVRTAAKRNAELNTTMTDGDKSAAKDAITNATPEKSVDISNADGIKEKADAAETAIKALKYLTTQQRSDVETALKQVTTQEQIDAIKREYAQYNSDQNTTLSTEDKEKNKSFIANTTDNSADAAMEQSGKDGYKATIKQLLTTLKYLTTNEQLPAAQAEVDKAETASNDQIDAVVRTYAAINADQNSTMTNGEKAKAKNDLKTQSAEQAVDTSNANGHITQANAAKALVDQLNYLVTKDGQAGDATAIKAAKDAIDNAVDTDTMDAAVRTAAKRNAELNTTKTDGEKQAAKDTITSASPEKAVEISNADGHKSEADAADALIEQLKYLNKQEKQAYKDQIALKTTPADIDAVVKTAAVDNTNKNTTMATEDKDQAKTTINTAATTPQDAVTASNTDGYKTTMKTLLGTLKYLDKDVQLPQAEADVDKAENATKEQIDAVVRTWAATNAGQNSTMTKGEQDQAKTILAGQDVNTAVATSNADGIKTYADAADALIAALKYQSTDQKGVFNNRIAASTTKAQIDAIVKEAARDNTNANTTMATEDKDAAISTIFAADTSTSAAVDKSNEDGYKTTIKQLLTTLKYLSTDTQVPAAQADVDKASNATKAQIDAVVRTWAETNADQNKTMTAGDKTLAKSTLRYQDVNAAVATSNADGNLAYATKADELIDKLKYLDDTAKQSYKDQIAQRTSEYAIDNLVRQAAADNADVNPTMTDGDKATAKTTLAGQSPSDAVDTSNGTGNLDDAKDAYEVIDKLDYLSKDQKAQAKKDINNAPNGTALAQVVTDALNTNADQNTTMTDEDKQAAKQIVTSGTTQEAITTTNANGQKATAKGLIDQLKYLSDDDRKAAYKLIDAATTNQAVYQVVYDYANTNVDQNTTMTPGNRVVAKNTISTQQPADAVTTSNADGDASYATSANALVESMKYLTDAQKLAAKTDVANAPNKAGIDQAVKDAALTNTSQNSTMSTEDKAAATTINDPSTTPGAATAASNADGQKVAAKKLVEDLHYLSDAEKSLYTTQIDSAAVASNADILAVVKQAATDNTEANPTFTDAEKASTKADIALATTTGSQAVDKSNEIGENGTLDEIKDAAKKFIDSLTNLTDTEKTIAKGNVDLGTDYNSVLDVAKDAARDDINGSTFASPANLSTPLTEVDEATGLAGLKEATTDAVKLDASALIDKLTNLSTEQKTEAKQQIADADSTPAAISIASNAVNSDIAEMTHRDSSTDTDGSGTGSDTDTGAGTGATTNIAALGAKDLKALSEDASAAIDTLGNLSSQQKSTAKAQISSATSIDGAIEALQSTLGTNVTTLPTPGTTPATAKVNDMLDSSLKDFKTAAKNAIDAMVNLTEDEKTAAKNTIDQATTEVSALATVNAATSTDIDRLKHLDTASRADNVTTAQSSATLSNTVTTDLSSYRNDAITRINALKNLEDSQKADYLTKVNAATTAKDIVDTSDAAKAEDDAILAAAMSRARAGIQAAEALLDKVIYTRADQNLKDAFDQARQQLAALLESAANGDVTAKELDAKLAELTAAQDALNGKEENKTNWALIGGVAAGIAALGAGIASLAHQSDGQAPTQANNLAGETNSSSNGTAAQAIQQPSEQSSQDAQQTPAPQPQAQPAAKSAVSKLARTGADLYSPIFWGLVLMLLGGTAYIASRRRHSLAGRHHNNGTHSTHPMLRRIAKHRAARHRKED